MLDKFDALQRFESAFAFLMHRTRWSVVSGKVGGEAFLGGVLLERGGVGGDENSECLDDVETVRRFGHALALGSDFLT